MSVWWARLWGVAAGVVSVAAVAGLVWWVIPPIRVQDQGPMLVAGVIGLTLLFGVGLFVAEWVTGFAARVMLRRHIRSVVHRYRPGPSVDVEASERLLRLLEEDADHE